MRAGQHFGRQVPDVDDVGPRRGLADDPRHLAGIARPTAPPSMSHGNADNGVTTPSPRSTTRALRAAVPDPPPFAADTPPIRARAGRDRSGRAGRWTPGDDLSDPITLITDPAKSAHNPNNPTMTAGFTFLGQFLDHDMTFDPTSSLARRQDPESIRNFRIPALDLDSLYGGGPACIPHLYDQTVDGGRTTHAGRGDPRLGRRDRSTATRATTCPATARTSP